MNIKCSKQENRENNKLNNVNIVTKNSVFTMCDNSLRFIYHFMKHDKN